ncbi:MAG: lipid A export permease/ATP-binding protein MsbA [Woeseiaceae bacterium]|jgi:subfamily B ATP-binding cassette protein MsbA|nr:lipid A export permease/ATP-binding protein MsbA [Woeseiaceae bacterium]MDG1712634.1 lipid A export permease/ATP-binding protein MsbA [Woeseiaceae bacterium]MDG1866000.1 lipid A export permease/ATP-binding protein MsbA [Woeseiaceae bacterium]|tara:strand:+ start:154 stop:1902 length:1749 start_codon:yes stop_codon:yes gene_type:complete
MKKSEHGETLETYKRLWRYVIPYKVIGGVAVIAMASTAFVETAMVALIEPLLDEALVAKNLEASKWLPFAFVLIFIARGISGFASEASLGWIGRGVISSLRREVFEKFLYLPTKYFENNTTGRLLSRMTYNVEMVAESVTNVVTILVRDVLTVIAAIALMIYQSPKLFFTVALVLPLITMLVKFLGSVFRRYSQRIQDSIGEVTQVTEEALTSHKIIKIFGGQEYELERLIGIDEDNRKQNLKLIRSRSMGVAVTQVLFGFGLAGVIYFAGVESVNGDLSPGSFMSFFGAMMLMLQPIRRITNVNAILQRGMAASSSLFEIIDEPSESERGLESPEICSGKIEFKDVNFSYDGKLKIIDDVSFTVTSGQSLAIVGHSGSGKSTLINLLPRFYDYESGEILLDDIALQDYETRNLRQKISLVSQDVVLFNDSILNNLAYGELRGRSKDDLLNAAKLARILEFSDNFPNGLDTIIGDKGVLLSGGQRQRIAIGRAILKDAPILILDEATSSLDTKSEYDIQAALKDLMKDRTTLVVAHRLSTIESADQIIVLEKGRIVEKGDHKTLLSNNSFYSDLHRLQFKEK